MSLCINTKCLNAQNSDNLLFCQSCGSELLLEGRYRIARIMGGGGFGKTFEVSDVKSNIPKVLKVLINEHPKAVELFQREAEVLSQLNYPGIPKVDASGYFTFFPRDSQEPLHCQRPQNAEVILQILDGFNNNSTQPVSTVPPTQPINYQPQVSSPMGQQIASTILSRSPAAQPITPVKKSNARNLAGEEIQYAGFWARFAAFLLDTIISYIILLMAAYLTVVIANGVFNITSPSGLNSLVFILGITIDWLYYSYLESSPKQATIGKQALGICVTDMQGNRVSFSQATIRYFSKILSAFLLLIGFIMVAFTQKKQGLHDMIASTLVVKK